MRGEGVWTSCSKRLTSDWRRWPLMVCASVVDGSESCDEAGQSTTCRVQNHPHLPLDLSLSLPPPSDCQYGFEAACPQPQAGHAQQTSAQCRPVTRHSRIGDSSQPWCQDREHDLEQRIHGKKCLCRLTYRWPDHRDRLPPSTRLTHKRPRSEYGLMLEAEQRPTRPTEPRTFSSTWRSREPRREASRSWSSRLRTWADI